MKVLFDVDHSFAWAHGGVQVLVENLMNYLPKIGVEVEPLRWWDAEQKGDILQTFYSPSLATVLAKQNGLKIVNYAFMDGLSSKSKTELFFRKTFIRTFKKTFYNYATELGWNYGDISDAYIYPSNFDMKLGEYLFNAKRNKAHVILHGIDKKYLNMRIDKQDKENYLISIATIHPRKNSVLLAELSHEIGIPIIFIGKPYKDDDYFKKFISLADGKYVIYKGYITEEEKIELLMKAKGFILLSKAESGCIAVLEALAMDCSIFLPDLGWARSIYDNYAVFGNMQNIERLKQQIKMFYKMPLQTTKKFPILSWKQVSQKYLDVYKNVLAVK